MRGYDEIVRDLDAVSSSVQLSIDLGFEVDIDTYGTYCNLDRELKTKLKADDIIHWFYPEI